MGMIRLKKNMTELDILRAEKENEARRQKALADFRTGAIKSQEAKTIIRVCDEMKKELASKVEDAGIEIVEVRLNQIAYAPEIAAAMLQRQQAIAVIAARKKIVEGAVTMVEMALDKLKEDDVVDLDEERKAQMVSNLLVVLCSSKEANPILNAGSIY